MAADFLINIETNIGKEINKIKEAIELAKELNDRVNGAGGGAGGGAPASFGGTSFGKKQTTGAKQVQQDLGATGGGGGVFAKPDPNFVQRVKGTISINNFQIDKIYRANMDAANILNRSLANILIGIKATNQILNKNFIAMTKGGLYPKPGQPGRGGSNILDSGTGTGGGPKVHRPPVIIHGGGSGDVLDARALTGTHDGPTFTNKKDKTRGGGGGGGRGGSRSGIHTAPLDGEEDLVSLAAWSNRTAGGQIDKGKLIPAYLRAGNNIKGRMPIASGGTDFASNFPDQKSVIGMFGEEYVSPEKYAALKANQQKADTLDKSVLLEKKQRKAVLDSAAAERKKTDATLSSNEALKKGNSIMGAAIKRAAMWAVASGIIFGTMRAASEFIQIMIKMDKQMMDLRKTLAGTEGDFRKLTDASVDIARRFKANTQDVLDAVELFSKKFKRSADLETLAKSAILFSNISGQSLKQSAETITSVLQQYNLSVSEAETVTDQWATVAAQTAVTVTDLGDAVGGVGIAAKTVGLDLSQLNAIVGAVVGGTGQSGKQVATGLRRIFERTTAPRNTEKLQKMGVQPFMNTGSIEEPVYEMRPFMDILDDVNEKWSTFNDTKRKDIATAFAGARQYNSFLAIMNNYSEITRLMTVQQNSLGEATAQNDRIADTFVKKIQRLGVEFDALARNSNIVLDALGGLVDVMTVLLTKFNSLNKTVGEGGMGKIGGYIQGATAALALGSAAHGVTNFAMRHGALASLNPEGQLIGKAGMGERMVQTGFITSQAGGKPQLAVRAGLSNVGRGIMGGFGKSAAAGAAAGVGGSAAASAAATAAAGVSLGALALGAAAVVAGLAVFIGTVTVLAKIFNELSNNSQEYLEKQDQIGRKARQESRTQFSQSERLNKLSEQREKLEGGGSKNKLRSFDREITGFLEDLQKTNPEKISESGIIFDKFGVAINVTGEALKKLSKDFDELGSKTRTTAQKERAIELRKTAMATLHDITGEGGISGLFSQANEEGDFLVPRNEQLQTPVRPGQVNFGVRTPRKGRVQFRRSESNKAISELIFETADIFKETIKADKQLLSKKVDISKDLTPDEVAKLQEEEGFLATDSGNRLTTDQVNDIIKSLRATREIRKALKDAFGTEITEAYAKSEKAGRAYVESLPDRAVFKDIKNKKTREFANAYLLRPAMIPYPDEVIPKKDTDGDDKPFGSGRTVEPKDIERIDLAVQRSMIENSRKFSVLGAANFDLVGAQISAMEQGIVDFATDSSRAAGPEEYAAISERRAEIAELKTESKIGDGLTASQEERLTSLTKEQLQSVQEMNREREKGIAVLKKELEVLRFIHATQEAAKSAFKSTISSTVLGSADRNKRSMALDERKLRLESEMQNLNRVNGANFSTENASRVKALKEELQGVTNEMKDLNKETDFFGNAISKIGETLVQKGIDWGVDTMFNSLGAAASGMDGEGFSIFGDSNPQVNALKANTDALNANTRQLGGTGTGGAGGIPGAEGDSGTGFFSSKGTSFLGGTASAGGMIMGGLAGAGVGSAMTSMMGKEGIGGTTGGAIGGAVGSIWGMGAIGGVVGGFLGQFFDEKIKAEVVNLDVLAEPFDRLAMSMEKNTNTINDIMENLINAPSSFVLPIPKGMLENSITAQSAIATPLQAGGVIMRSGPIFAHAGETVVPAGEVSGGGAGGMSVNININGSESSPKQIANNVMNELNKAYKKQSLKSSDYVRRFR